MHCSCLLPLLHSPPTSLLQLATLHPPPPQSFADPDSSSIIPIAITVWLISQTQRTIVVTVFSPSSSIQVSVFFAIVQPLPLFLLLLFLEIHLLPLPTPVATLLPHPSKSFLDSTYGPLPPPSIQLS